MAALSHTRLQQYDRHYCKTLVTGIYGCRWQRYQQSQEPTRLLDRLFFIILALTWALSTFWFYFWLVCSSNDFDNVNYFMSSSLGIQFYSFDSVFVGLTSSTFVYNTVLMLLAIVHIYQSHELYLHKVHKILVPFFLAFGLAQIFVVNGEYNEGWSLVYLSFQVFGPFLQIGGVVIATFLSFVIARRWNGMYSLGKKLVLLWFYCCVMLVIYVSPLFLESPLISTSPVPPRPNFIAHRGLCQFAPENTKMAFERAVMYDNIIGVESDVTISWDGIPFIAHDKNLIRTTNIQDIFPNRTKTYTSDFNISDLKQLDAGSWFLRRDPFGTVHRLNESDKTAIRNQKIPTLKEVLDILKDADQSFMFDILFSGSENHPYRETYRQKIVDVILESGIEHKRIWWLYYHSTYPNGTSNFTAVQAGSPPIEHLLANGVFITNMRYDTFHLDRHRSYTLNNVTSVVYTINAYWLYSYLWSAGVSIISTDYAADFATYIKPLYHMTPDVYNATWITIDCVSAVVVFAMFLGIWLRHRGSVFNPETLSLQSAKTHLANNKNKTMKEKLIHAAEGIQDIASETDFAACCDTELGIVGLENSGSSGVNPANSSGGNTSVVSQLSRSSSAHSNHTEVSVHELR